ncbi:mpv17-like protein 2 [Harmonia axyridis]|uniref:mpv17-like protein 2 n=1 Tax=Harmonia axyridis TaxID=115357 RepID=UPI001E276D12|nr:mpv17-like protein 2 [Harmonia axyridis]
MPPNYRHFFKAFELKNVKSTARKAFSKKYLFYTNVFISFTLSGAGDFVEQQYEKTKGTTTEYNLTRTKNMSISGGSAGALTHFWYIYLDKIIPGASFPIVVKKLILDQLICSPFVIVNMFVIVGFLEKKTGKEIFNEIKNKSITLYIAEWIVWPPAQFINFYLIPGRFRILYDNIISFGYDIYYSSIKYR